MFKKEIKIVFTLMGFESDEVRKKTVEKISRIDEAHYIQEYTYDIQR